MVGSSNAGSAFELPKSLQFVYADLSSKELARVRREVVPGREHDAAAQRTMRLVTDLVPARLSNSADVAESLRLHLDEDTVDWLPGKQTDPRVGPLIRGAGQLPTVGRAVLFETIHRNPDTATLAIKEALADINESNGDLRVISGGRSSRVDPVIVFVVFSVAGGTGSGIYYDYLHLIADIMQRGGKQAEIYPLVLMPSSFDLGQGGGRPAELNAGSALVDLFRLVDDQNAQATPDFVDARGTRGAVSVRYPQLGQVTINASTIQTAFLFGRPIGGVKRDDLHRSMVSLMVSLIGGSPSDPVGDDEIAGQQEYQSFADGFINGAVDRNAVSSAGIGRRGVTTSAVAATTTPVLEITDIIASRLLAKAVLALLDPNAAIESNRAQIRQFIGRSQLDIMLNAAPASLPDDGAPVGHNAVLATLSARARAMAENLANGPAQLDRAVAEQATRFNPADAMTVLLGEVDLFRAQRILFGHTELRDPVDRGGFERFLESWRIPPDAPPGFIQAQPPQSEGVQRRLTRAAAAHGRRRASRDPAAERVVRVADPPAVQLGVERLPPAVEAGLGQLRRPGAGHQRRVRDVLARGEAQQFDLRSTDLYKPRVGVSYLLPPEDDGLNGFYKSVLERLKNDFEQHLGPNADEGDVLNVLLRSAGGRGWAPAYAEGAKKPESAVAVVRQRIKEVVSEKLRPVDRSRAALIPRMEDLLAAAAGSRDRGVTDRDVERFRQSLAELVPGGFAPDGSGPLTALVVYPAPQADRDLERLLRREIALPRDMRGEPEFRAVKGSDSMVVVLNRDAMGVTEVPELRDVVKKWSEAQRAEQPTDSLAWRRRLTQQTTYLLMDVRDRRKVLHHLLCAAWNGQLELNGDLASPTWLRVAVGSRDATPMHLDLHGLRRRVVLAQHPARLRAVDPGRRRGDPTQPRRPSDEHVADRPRHLARAAQRDVHRAGRHGEERDQEDRGGGGEPGAPPGPPAPGVPRVLDGAPPARVGRTARQHPQVPPRPAGTGGDHARVGRMTQTLDGTGEVVLIDLRGGASVPADLHGPVLVLDRADQLVEHAALYRRLAGDRLVAGVVCVVVGESPGPSSAAVLRLPDSLRYAAVLWAGDERGVRWNPSADVVRPLGPEERGTIDQLVDALMVPEVFERVRAETEGLVGGVASPGLCLVPGGVDRHELADARAAAVESLTTPGLGRTTSADDLLVRVARAGGASDVMPAPLVPGSPLHKAQTDALTRLDRLADLARDLGTWRALIGRERPTEALGSEVSLAGARAENYRLGLVELLDRMDGHLVLGTPAADQVTSLGVPAPVEARHAEASTELRRAVQERLNAGQPLPDLAADLRHAAANATPQGCAGSLEQVQATGPLALAMPRFRSSPLSVWTALLAFLCCAVMGFVLGPGWPGRIGALVLVLFWAGAGWLLRARRPDAEGEHGLGAAAVPALLLHGLPALLGGAVGVAVATVVPGILRPSSVTLQLLALLAVLVTLMTPVVCWSSAVRAWRKRFEVAELRKIVDGVSGVVEDAIKREWLQVERRRAVALTFEVVAAGVEEVGSSLAELGDRLFPRPTSGAGAAPGVAGLLRAVPPELLDVVRADLVAIAQRSLASSWVAAPSGRRAPAGVQAQLLEGELERAMRLTSSGTVS